MDLHIDQSFQLNDEEELIGELYSVLYTLNSLEKLFIRGKVHSDQEKDVYISSTDSLLVQGVNILDTFNISVNSNEGESDLANKVSQLFKRGIDCGGAIGEEDFNFKYALKRLLSGVNGFKEQEENERERLMIKRDQEKHKEKEQQLLLDKKEKELKMESLSVIDKKGIAEVTSAFITLMDAIKLNYNTKENLHPLLSNILTKFPDSDFKDRNKLVQWLIKINKLSITDTLDETELKEFLWDVDNAYNGFFDTL